MIDLILIIIFFSIFIYILKVNISIVPNIDKYPFKKKKFYGRFVDGWDGFNYKSFYNVYEIDKKHKNYGSFDSNEFDVLLKSKHRLFLSLLVIECMIILILIIKD